MLSILNYHKTVVAFADLSATNNPTMRHVDWRRSHAGIAVEDPKSESFEIEPGATLAIFDATRILAVDNTTAFNITLNPVKDSVYRITNTGGAAPGFRAGRAVDLSVFTLTVAVNNNATVTFTSSAGTPFATVQVGDTVFIPNTFSGDAVGPFNYLNGGNWVVLGKTNLMLTVRRPVGELFQGANEVVVGPTPPQFRVFSSPGVQDGDKVRIRAGFSSVTWKTYEIQSVTDSWIEFLSAEPLPLESGILPGATGLLIYDTAKKFVLAEVDQEARVIVNDQDATNGLDVSPIVAGDVNSMGWFETYGIVWKMSILNRSPITSLSLKLISCE